MELSLEDLFIETKDLYNFNILAGKAGLYRSPKWLYFSEDINNVNFMESGELIIVTGYSYSNCDWILNFTKRIHEVGAVGLILNIGKYIKVEDISQEVITYCDEHNFPLLTMPWEIHVADVTQYFSRRIFEENLKNENVSLIIKDLINDHELLPIQEKNLISFGYHPKSTYIICIIPSSSSAAKGDIEKSYIKDFFSKNKVKIINILHQNNHIIIFNDITEELIQSLITKFIKENPHKMLKKNTSIGIGNKIYDIKDIKYAYDSALESLRYAKNKHINCGYFNNLGIDKLFFEVKNEDLLHSYHDCLKPLQDYDNKHNSDLLKTLYIYIKNNGSIQKVSEELFCHRNTINYRINRIKELLNIDLDNAENIFNLQLAYHVLNYFMML